MNDFWRAIGYVWPYRRRLMFSLVCGLVVAFSWGANISAFYPLLKVLLDKKTLVEWVDESIDAEEAKIDKLQSVIVSLERDAAEKPNDKSLQNELFRRRSERASRQSQLAWFQWGQVYVERYTPRDNFRTLSFLMGLVVIGMLIKCVFDFLQEYLSGVVVQLACFDLRNRFYRQTMGLDLSYFSEKGSHELMARFTNDVESLNSGMRALLGKVLLEPLKAFSCLICSFIFVGWRLTLVAMVIFPLAAIVMGLIGRYLKRMSRRNLESMSRIYKILQESFLGIRVVKAFTMERYERRRFFAETKRFNMQAIKLIRTDAISGPVLELLAVAAIAGALLFGSYLVMTSATEIAGIKLTYDPMDQSKLITFYFYIMGMCDPLRKVFSVYGRVQRGIASAERVFQCMDRVAEVRQKPRAPHLARHHETIEFRRVSFGYGNEDLVLRNVGLKVNFGETIAIVGATGCGKTTLINLIPRFYDTRAGAVLIDDVDIRDVSLKSLRAQVGLVTQHTLLFDDTITNNIAYGNRNVSLDLVKEAARAAYADEFIEKLPHGYDTRIGEMGDRLSGGQRQRIALARAILRDPAILILDEATSSLDVESEALIHKALRNFAKGRTTFVVTHRLSALDIADRIVVLKAGRVEAVGSHAELLGKSETYRRLFEVQARSA